MDTAFTFQQSHFPWETEEEKWLKCAIFLQILCEPIEFLIGGVYPSNLKNLKWILLGGLHRSVRLPFSPGLGRLAAMNGRSDRGDKKHRVGLLAMVRMQSHPLRVNGGEVTQRTTEDSGCLASRHTSASKLSPNLTHSASVQLPLVCQWAALYLPTSSWSPPHHTHTYILLAICKRHGRGGWGQWLPQLVRFVLAGCREPQEHTGWRWSIARE